MNLYLRLCLAFLPLIAVIAFAVADAQRINPGPLIASHRAVAELQGKDGCDACHAGKPAQLASNCLQCHEVVAEHIQTGAALHGNLTAAQQLACASCHPEHLTHDSDAVLAFGFQQATDAKASEFSHQTVQFDLNGRHGELTCEDCHPYATAEKIAAGDSRFLDQIQTCTSCHDDPHNGEMKRSCEACHGQEHKFDDLSQFPHDAQVPLHGSHSGLQCTDCHAEETPYSVTALSDVDAAQIWRTCAACHQSPHNEKFLSAQDNPAATGAEDGCVLCHSAEHAEFFGDEVEWQDSWHAASGFSLSAPHNKLSCEECHQQRQNADDFAARYPGRTEEACKECHQDPHAGQFDHPPFLQQGCLACHSKHEFAPHEFGLKHHNRDSFELTGSHADIECNACHILQDDNDQASRQFFGTPQKCEECHDDAHIPDANYFDPILAAGVSIFHSRLQALPVNEQGSCAQCHSTTDFRDQSPDFDHAKWTGFALQNGHANLSCEECHQRTKVADANGRTLGWVHQLNPGQPAACDGCHQDVHEGGFDNRSVGNRIGCDRCHQTTNFKDLRPADFDHAKWTGFALQGAHLQAECASCHGFGPDQKRLGKVANLFPGDPAQCNTCHADPHQGDFDKAHFPRQVQGRRGCERCHDSDTFKMASKRAFDHGSWTAFELNGAHAKAACASCHTPLPKANELGRRLSRAVGSACIDCHSDPHAGQFLQQGQNDCLRCHDSETQNFDIAQFDHDKHSRFALDPTHNKLACDACHATSPTATGASIVRYKPLGTACQDCHSVIPDPSGSTPR